MIFDALLPVFLMILLGRLLAWRGFPHPEFWPSAERLIYYLLFPALLFGSLVSAPFRPGDVADLAIALYPPILVIGLALLLARPLLGWTGPGFSSVFQGSTRFNTYVGLAVAGAVFGPSGLAVAAVAIGVLVPFLNVLCVLVLVVFGSSHHQGWRGMVSQIFANPLILACAAGLAVNFSGLELPSAALDGIGFLGRAALPMGLLAVGAGLRLRWQHGDTSALLVASLAKLVVLPWLVLLMAEAAGLPRLAIQVTVVFAALPTATAAFVLARQMGGDHELMARLITLETLLAVLSLPWVLSWVV